MFRLCNNYSITHERNINLTNMSDPETEPQKHMNEEKDTVIDVYDGCWNDSEERLVEDMYKVCFTFYWLHDQSYRVFRKKDIHFTLPVIVLTTVLGTLNFAQGSLQDVGGEDSSLSETVATVIPFVLGCLNISASIISTTAKFLNISTLRENHKVAYLAFAKLCRTIKIELGLPREQRNAGGKAFLQEIQKEIERMLENTPFIPKDVIVLYENTFGKFNAIYDLGSLQKEKSCISYKDCYANNETPSPILHSAVISSSV